MADDTAWYSSSPCSAVPRGGLIDPPHETDPGRECRTQRDTARQKRAESRIRPRMRHPLSGTDRRTNAVPDPCRPVSRRTDPANHMEGYPYTSPTSSPPQAKPHTTPPEPT